MNSLSRREEETLLKATKERALKECDELVKGVLLTAISFSFTNYAILFPRICCLCQRSAGLTFLGMS